MQNFRLSVKNIYVWRPRARPAISVAASSAVRLRPAVTWRTNRPFSAPRLVISFAGILVALISNEAPCKDLTGG